MKRLFSILMVSGIIMASSLSYPNQYKDFTIGAINGTSTTLIDAAFLNLMKNLYHSVVSVVEKVEKQNHFPYFFYQRHDDHFFTKELASSIWNSEWWLPLPVYAAGFAIHFAMSDSVGVKLKNDHQKFGYLIGSITTIAGIINCYLHAKR